MMSCNTMAIYWITDRLNPPGQLGITVLIGMDHPLYNDRSIIFVVYYKYAIIDLYTTSIVSLGMVRCNTMDIYSGCW